MALSVNLMERSTCARSSSSTFSATAATPASSRCAEHPGTALGDIGWAAADGFHVLLAGQSTGARSSKPRLLRFAAALKVLPSIRHAVQNWAVLLPRAVT
jgi:hypothetical protein